MVADAGDLYRVLERQEYALTGPILRSQFQQIFAFKRHFTCGDLILFPASQRGGKRAFAGTVGPHNGVHFARFDVQAQPFEDFISFGADVQILDT
ncbi:hypothetical protein D3C76_1327120 [compost metagenome]